MLRISLLALAVYVGAVPAQAGVSGNTAVNDRPILELIGEIEGPDGYDDVVLDAPFQPPRPITLMTINEVLDYQRQLQLEGARSTAVGRFQFIRKTLAYMVKKHRIDGEQRFSKRMQDHLARRMLVECEFYERSASDHRVGNCLARAWAALPMLSGEKAGKSYYGADGTNKAHATRAEVLTALRRRFEGGPVEVVEITLRNPLPVIRKQDASRFADRIPLKP